MTTKKHDQNIDSLNRYSSIMIDYYKSPAIKYQKTTDLIRNSFLTLKSLLFYNKTINTPEELDKLRQLREAYNKIYMQNNIYTPSPKKRLSYIRNLLEKLNI